MVANGFQKGFDKTGRARYPSNSGQEDVELSSSSQADVRGAQGYDPRSNIALLSHREAWGGETGWTAQDEPSSSGDVPPTVINQHAEESNQAAYPLSAKGRFYPAALAPSEDNRLDYRVDDPHHRAFEGVELHHLLDADLGASSTQPVFKGSPRPSDQVSHSAGSVSRSLERISHSIPSGGATGMPMTLDHQGELRGFIQED